MTGSYTAAQPYVPGPALSLELFLDPPTGDGVTVPVEVRLQVTGARETRERTMKRALAPSMLTSPGTRENCS